MISIRELSCSFPKYPWTLPISKTQLLFNQAPQSWNAYASHHTLVHSHLGWVYSHRCSHLLYLPSSIRIWVVCNLSLCELHHKTVIWQIYHTCTRSKSHPVSNLPLLVLSWRSWDGFSHWVHSYLWQKRIVFWSRALLIISKIKMKYGLIHLTKF